MKISFLSSQSPLTKRFTLCRDGSYTKESFLNAFHVSSHTETLSPQNTLDDFAKALRFHAKKGHCLLKGNVTRDLVKESRAGSTDKLQATQWLCLDIDGLPDMTIDTLMDLLGMGNTSYILQWSSSYNITSTDLRCHIFVLLDRPIAAPIIKQWLIEQNLQVEGLRNSIKLSKSGMGLTWPLDITACQNDKLLYIAPPQCVGFKDPFTIQQRIRVVHKTTDRFVFPDSTATSNQNKEQTDQLIAMLRQAAGLPKRKFTTKFVRGSEVVVKAEGQTMTGIKHDRGFVYFNINGGDSWGYYHPENDPHTIYNFKGEPNYATKEFLPEYWSSLTDAASRESKHGPVVKTWMAISDRRSGAYLKVTHSTGDGIDDLDVQVAKSEKQLRDFAAQYGIPLGDFIPEWNVVFDPQSDIRIDKDTKTLNLFSPTKYMLAPTNPNAKLPPIIKKVIYSMLNNEGPTIEHFLNWLAFIVQRRSMTMTAWVLQGKQGTGKGTLIHKILRPMFGSHQTTFRLMNELAAPYNPWMKNNFIVFVDEFEAKALYNESGVTAKMKSYITEPQVPVRDLYQGAVDMDNYTNWILSSNKPANIRVDRGDRRFNIGGFQHKQLVMTEKEIDSIESELQEFYDFLMLYNVDVAAVRTPLRTQERQNMIDTTETGAETVANAITEGDMQFFIDQLPTDDKWRNDPMRSAKIHNYRSTLLDILQRSAEGRHRMSRDELFTLFEYCVGNVPDSPNKFSSYLRHVRIFLKNSIRIDKRVVVGLEMQWKNPETFHKLINEHFLPEITTRKTMEKAMQA